MVKAYMKYSKCLICPIDYDFDRGSYVLTCVAEDGQLLNFIIDDYLASELIGKNYLYHFFSKYCTVSYHDVDGLELDNIYLLDFDSRGIF